MTGQRMLVVGGGVTGLLTAVRCVLDGHQVVVLERGAIPNPWSSSFDQHRAIRALDPGDVAATRRAAIAHHRWLELESLLCDGGPGAGFYRRVGVLTSWPAAEVAAVAAVARDAGIPVEIVPAGRFPHLRFPAGTSGVLELDAGVLLADRALRAAARWLGRQRSAILRPWRDVAAVDPAAGRVVLADGTVESGDAVLVAAGPWSRALVDAPITLHRQTMVYLRPPDELARWWATAPSAGRIGADGRGWLLPPGNGTLLKVSTDAVCREVVSVDGADRDDETRWADRVMAAEIVPDMDRYTVVAVKRCHYAVDALTGSARLIRAGPAAWVRAASGGDGFRMAPLVADQVADALSPTQPSPFPVSISDWKESP
jgi:glycine/D-amino acid oxidase-like deaminating enzyme